MIEDIFKLGKMLSLFASLYEAFSQKVRLYACNFGRDSGGFLGINPKDELQEIAEW